jgi:2-methylcitrate dehydratase PrpD
MSRSDLLHVADKVIGTIDPELQAIYPRKFAGRVRFRMRDGSVIEDTVFDSRSTPANPITRADIIDKFCSVTSDVLSQAMQTKIIEAVMSLEAARNLSHLASLVRDEG